MIVGYRSQTSHYSTRWRDSIYYIARHGRGSEDINHYSLFNVLESVVGVGKIGFRSRNSPSPSNHSGDYGRSSGFIILVITEVNICLRKANFLHITMVYLPFLTQCFFNKIFQEVCMDKIYIKTILIIFIQAYQHTLIKACHHILITTCHLIFL